MRPLQAVRKPEPDTGATPADHAVLAARAARGDRDAFGELFRIYAPMVHGILLARAPASEVRDLMQDVFVLALEKLASLRDADAFGGWIAMIARNRTVDFHRRRSHRKTTPLETEPAVSDPDRAEVEEFLSAIRELPATYAETLVLRLVEGMSGPEIAARVGMKPESVRVNLHRGMTMLRERLRGERS